MDSQIMHVLIIEDQESDLLLLQEALSELSQNVEKVAFEIEYSLDLAGGLDKLIDKRSFFDVILLDLGLPDASGLEAFLKVYNEARDTPIVIVTGLREEDRIIRAVREGLQDCLFKEDIVVGDVVKVLKRSISTKRRRLLGSQHREMDDALNELDEIVMGLMGRST